MTEEMFDINRPLTPQIFEWMVKLDFDKAAIDYAREQIEQNKDLRFADHLCLMMAKMRAAEIILAENTNSENGIS